ncbi:MAG: cytochrome b/b6 domain-containing protein [Hyphomicrobium sp.]|jgi:cytochrome b
MTTFEKIRLSHAALAVGCVLAYFTGEAGIVHAWIGYGVAAIIALRLVWGLFGPRQVGISRLVPTLEQVSAIRWLDHPAVSKILLSSIIVSLLVVSGTGIALGPGEGEGGREHAALSKPVSQPAVQDAGGLSQVFIGPARADDDEEGEEDESGEWIEEIHEVSANLLFLFVGLHVGYVLLFKRKLAFYMLFTETPPARGS